MQQVSNSVEAFQKLKAAIVTDGSLCFRGKHANFSMSLSDHKDYLIQRGRIPIKELMGFLQLFTSEVLLPLDIEPCSGHPREQVYTSTGGKKFLGVCLQTCVSDLLTELYIEYYSRGTKIIPESFTLSPLSLAWMYMFDGSSSWSGRGSSEISTYFCTQGLDLHSIEIFEDKLHSLGVSTGKNSAVAQKGSGIMITILQNSVDKFMSTVDPYVLPPFRYKIKYRGSCPPELASLIREKSLLNKQIKQGYQNPQRDTQLKWKSCYLMQDFVM